MYEEDEKAECDMNVVATNKAELIDISAFSGGDTFKKDQFLTMLDVALKHVIKITEIQKSIISKY